MKMFFLVVIVLASEARAQGELDPLFNVAMTLGIGLSAGAMSGGVATGLGSTAAVARQEPSAGWFVSSFVMAGFNLAGAALCAHLAVAFRSADQVFNNGLEPGWVAASLAHLGIGLWNVVAPIAGLVRGPREMGITPQLVFLRGRPAGLGLLGSF